MHGLRKRLKEVRDKFDKMMEKIIRRHEEARNLFKETGVYYVPQNLLDILLGTSEYEALDMNLTRENIKALIKVNTL